jgi:isopentenyl diphosphate isomerase/L-lactate dehydrogenase-like FMN-dependent dehydrogenase
MVPNLYSEYWQPVSGSARHRCFKATALGAKTVGVGRPIIWGLAVDGQQGARRILDMLRKDFQLAMKQCGCTSVQDIIEALIFNPPD